MSRTPSCANCKSEEKKVRLRQCERCRKNFCSPILRDCVWEHGCKGAVVKATVGMRSAIG
jgi:hypothetical protein